MKLNMKILSVFSEAKKLFVSRWSTLLCVSLIAALIWKIWRIFAIPSLMIMARVSPDISFINPSDGTVGSLSLILFVSFVYFIILISIANIYSVLILEHKKFNHNVINDGLNLVIPVAFTSFLLSLILSLGMMFFIIPFFIIGFFLQFSVLTAILTGKKGLEAIWHSAAIIWKNLKKTFVFSLLLWIPITVFHILTRRIFSLSVLYHTLIIPFVFTCQYIFYKKLTR